MPTLGKSTNSGTCAICDKSYKKAVLVYHDPFKRLQKSVVHALCWEELRKSRGILLGKSNKGAETLSKVALDPPF